MGLLDDLIGFVADVAETGAQAVTRIPEAVVKVTAGVVKGVATGVEKTLDELDKMGD